MKVFNAFFIFLFCFNSLQAEERIIQTEKVFEKEKICIEIQKVESEDGVIFWRVMGFIAGEIISNVASEMASNVCSSFGGHSSTCSFVGDVTGMLTGMRRIGRTATRSRTYIHTSSRNGRSSVSTNVKYDARNDKGEVEYRSTSDEAIKFAAESLASHYFNGLIGNTDSAKTRVPANPYYNQPSYTSPSNNASTYPRGTLAEELARTECAFKILDLATQYRVEMTWGTERKAEKILKKINRLKSKCGL